MLYFDIRENYHSYLQNSIFLEIKYREVLEVQAGGQSSQEVSYSVCST